MKKSGKYSVRWLYPVLLALLFAGARPAAAQHYVGVRGGVGGGSVRFEPSRETQMLFALPVFGVSYKYYGFGKVVGGIQADLNYIVKGYKELERPQGDTSYQRRLTAVELPVMWQPHVYFFKRRMRVFLNAGPYLSYNISSSYKVVSKKNGVLESGTYRLESLRDNRLEYGLAGGGGFSVAVRRFEIQTEFRYVFGYSDMLKNGNKYPGNPLRSPMSHMNVTLGLYYRLGQVRGDD